MANEEHLAILKQALEKKDIRIWNKWREENPDIRVNLEKVHLSNKDLSHVNFMEANLEGAELDNTNLQKADLTRARLFRASLKQANLTEINMRAVRLEFSDLRGAVLIGADAGKADFTGANMSGADCSVAAFWETKLRNTDLSFADLRWTNLRGAILTYTNLHNAKLYDASIGNTVFGSVNLAEAIDVDKVGHWKSSHLDIDTIYKSGGKISEVFLRGCGVPDNMIAYAKSLVGKPIGIYRAFISYSHAKDDIVFAKRLEDRLQREGIRCWRDDHEMIAGQKIDRQIDRGLQISDKTILICSKKSLKSWWVDQELATSFEIEREMQKSHPDSFRVIPVDIDGFIDSPECNAQTTVTSGKLSQIRQRYIGQFKGWKHDNDIFEREIEKVIRALRTDSGKEAPPESKL